MRALKKTLAGSLAILTLASTVPASANNEFWGTIFGMAGGALAGSQIGKGDGRTAAIAGGAVIFGLLGNRIGHAMDDYEREQYMRARREALEGRRIQWTGTRHQRGYRSYGTITPLPQPVYYVQDYSRACRSYRTEVYFGGYSETQTGYACQDSCGNWEEVEERFISQTAPGWSQTTHQTRRSQSSGNCGGYGGYPQPEPPAPIVVEPGYPQQPRPNYPPGGYRPAVVMVAPQFWEQVEHNVKFAYTDNERLRILTDAVARVRASGRRISLRQAYNATNFAVQDSMKVQAVVEMQPIIAMNVSEGVTVEDFARLVRRNYRDAMYNALGY